MLRRLLLALWASQALATNILLPLYFSPANDAWQPLYDALNGHPSVVFEVIINPNSGPSSNTPDPVLAEGIKKLRTYPNAAILGYVPTNYGKRDVSTVEADIALYAAWPAGVAPTGIFFDEVDYSQAANLKSLAKKARHTLEKPSSELLKNAARVVFNPGKLPDSKSSDVFEAADRVVIFEDPYDKLEAQAAGIAAQGKATGVEGIALIVHTTPRHELEKVTSKYVTMGVGSLYVTSNNGTYQDFGNLFGEFVGGVAVDVPN